MFSGKLPHTPISNKEQVSFGFCFFSKQFYFEFFEIDNVACWKRKIKIKS
jgi:hypothetical protein